MRGLRFGYPLAFLDRQKLLQILAAGPVQSSRVKLGHQVVNIESTHDGVTVRTSNGHVYQGDLVVGADGVHSRIRAEMWRLANASQGEIFRSEYNSIYPAVAFALFFLAYLSWPCTWRTNAPFGS